MKTLVVGIFFMKIFYFFIKLFNPTRDQITFISRQDSGYSLDMDLEVSYLKENYPEIKTVILYKKLDKSLSGMLSYIGHIFTQMTNIARSKVVVLDGYCIAISVLNHKHDLTVVQMWHALGSLKKFGYSILDQKEGRSSKISKVMRMHHNYDYILASSPVAAENFREAFNARKDQMLVLGLPRMDYLQSKEVKEKIRQKYFEIYPEANNGLPTVLYGPTMRKGKEADYQSLIDTLDLHKYNLMIKLHDGKEIVYVQGKLLDRGINFAGIEALHLADYFISDYSAMIYEASLCRLPIYLYVYDYDEYMEARGLYLDFMKEMPGFISKDIKEIVNAIDHKVNDNARLDGFLQRYITNRNENITATLGKFLAEKCED